MRTTAHAATGTDTPPGLDDWHRQTRLGMTGVSAVGVYLAVPFILFFLGAIFINPAIPEATPTLVDLAGATLSLIGLVLIIPLHYIVPGVLTAIAVNEEFWAGFDVGELRDVLLSREYLLALFGSYLLIQFVGIVVTTGVLVLTTGWGIILTPFVLVYLGLVASYLVGRAHRAARGELR